jgi:hypothetical protein
MHLGKFTDTYGVMLTEDADMRLENDEIHLKALIFPR